MQPGTGAGMAGVVAALCVALAEAANDVPPPRQDELLHLLTQDCGSCHGMTLGGGLGKPLTADRLAAWDRDQIAAIILNGVPGTPMPPWAPLLSAGEARWIANALKDGTLK